jgi:predicted PurR-regulated permease PerM
MNDAAKELARDDREADAARRPAGSETRSPVSGWALAATLAVVAVILYIVRYALLPFVFAAAVAFVFDPLIRALQHRTGSPRWVAGGGLFILFLAGVAALAYWAGTTAVRDAAQVAAQAPQILHGLAAGLAGPNGIELFGRTWTADTLTAAALAAAAEMFGAGAAIHAAATGLTAGFAVILTLVLTPYFMISGPRLSAGAVWLVPPERRSSVIDSIGHIAPVLRRYLIGIAAVVLFTGTVAWLGFGLAFRLPHAILLAIVVGLLEMIPVVGPLASAIIVGLTAVQQHNLWTAAGLGVFAIILRLVIDNLVGPLVLGAAARVHPVVVIFAFICGAMLFGVVGLLLAVPAAAAIKIVLSHYYAEPIAR